MEIMYEAVVRKRFSHPNLRPFLGVNVALFFFAHDIRMDETREDPPKFQAEYSEASAGCREQPTPVYLGCSYTMSLPGWIVMIDRLFIQISKM